MKWFPSDWRSDVKLRACEPLTRYVWLEMLGLMHEGEPYGHLTIAGKKMDPATLARLIDVPLKAVNAALRELDRNGVYSVTDDGIIFSRRLLRADFRATSSRLNGSKGGNPALKNQGLRHVQDNPPVKGEDKTQKPEARFQSLTEQQPLVLGAAPDVSQPTPLAAAAGSDLVAEYERVERMARQAAGLEADPSPGFMITAPLTDLMADGFDLEREILPVLRAKAAECRARGAKPRSWGYFVPAIREAKVRALVVANPAANPRPAFQSVAMQQADLLRAEIAKRKSAQPKDTAE